MYFPHFLLYAVLALLTGLPLHAWTQDAEFRPVWTEDRKVGDASAPFGKWAAPWFEGAVPDHNIPNLPFHDLLVPVAENVDLDIRTVTVENEFEMAAGYFRETARSRTETGWYPRQRVVLGAREVRRGKHYQHLHIYPIQVEWGSGRFRKAEAVQWRLQKKARPVPQTARSSKTYATESVLASGNWLKIGVTEAGIYKISTADLAAAGISSGQIDPRTLRLHGNGGQELPQQAGTFPYDDLRENAIWVSGEADGRFDDGDHLLFYGASPHRWEWISLYQRWYHLNNAYSDTTWYYLTWGQGNGRRIGAAPQPGAATVTPTWTDQYLSYEKDLFNPLKSGRYWLGESFDLETTKEFPLSTPGVRSGSQAKVSYRNSARSTVASSFVIEEGGLPVDTSYHGDIKLSGYGSWHRPASQTFELAASRLADGRADLRLRYNKPNTGSIGYLDYLEINWQQTLNVQFRDIWFFRAREGVGPGQVFQYNIAGDRGHRYWDITDPGRIQELNGPNFRIAGDSIRQMVAFLDGATRSPVRISRINNQNLHALSPAEYVIVAPPLFLSPAQRLAEFHRREYQRSVHVVSLPQIFNEFGSGQPSPVAIRDFFKMLYDRDLAQGDSIFRYALLFGDGSYDFKGTEHPNREALIPTYQARNSHHAMNSYTSDDFYSFLDDGEGFWGELIFGARSDYLYWMAGDTLIDVHGADIGIGRLPADDLETAHTLVDKIVGYKSNPGNRGTWRNQMVLVADHYDFDKSLHVRQADGYTSLINSAYPCINIEKIYLDNYQMESSASAEFFPDGEEALHRQLNEGALLVNYTGHGGETGWSNSSVLTISDINQLENGSRLPAYITATCEFGRWDDPGRRSGAEHLLLNPNGGAFAMLTTVRVVEAISNERLNENFYREVFKYDVQEQRWPTLGEVFQRTKNKSWNGGGINNRNFSLLGDPALALNYPEHRAVITHINGQAVDGSQLDSLPSLTKVRLQGEVRDGLGNRLDNFNGEASVTIFDKPSNFTTRRYPYQFQWQKNRVFNGKATVRNGSFELEFVVPVDVSYEAGKGKISVYVAGNNTDGAGCYDQVYPGGLATNAILDDRSPEVTLYMNDDKFVEGGLVGPSPTLIAEVYDENGLNTAGSGIGHDLTAVLDGNDAEIIVLNEYYQANLDSYQEGSIRYAFSDLEDGEHRLEVKVWDVANNSATVETHFVVADNAQMALGHVLNYPNPFSTRTQFYVEHNLNGRPLNIQVKVFTVSGRLVKTLQDSFYAEGNLYCDLEWDGLDDYGDALGRGVYVYQVLLRDESTGDKVSRFEKLVVLR